MPFFSGKMGRPRRFELTRSSSSATVWLCVTKRFIALPIGWRYTEADADYIADSVIAVHREMFG